MKAYGGNLPGLLPFAPVLHNDLRNEEDALGVSQSPPDGSRRLIALFLGLFLLFASLSPLYFRRMGYMEEEFIAAKQVITKAAGIVTGRDAAIEWPRHGAMPVMTHVPFVAAGRLVFGSSLEWQDRMFAMEPLVLSAGLLTILFVWARRLGASRGFAGVLTLAAGFATVIWPYAYFGMEPPQSFFLLAAAFIAICHRRVSWGAVVLLAITTGLAASVKSTGVFLLPALAYANWVFFRDSIRENIRAAFPKVFAAALIAGAIILLSAYSRSLFWVPRGGTSPYLNLWLGRDPITWLINVTGFLTSPNKGLFAFVPLALFSAAQIPSLIRKRSDVAIFAFLVTAAVAGGYPLFLVWSDETFGPRYFHCAMAPLILCIAEAYRGRERKALRHPGFVAALIAGFLVSSLGALFSYGHMQTVATHSGQATLQNFQSNPVWNHVRFNARLLSVWMSRREVLWTPEQMWIGERPAWVPPPSAVNLTAIRNVNQQEVARPQAFVLYSWGNEDARVDSLLRALLIAAFPCGVFLVAIALRPAARTGRDDVP